MIITIIILFSQDNRAVDDDDEVTAWQRPVMNFIDFRKAFDCIHRPLLW